MIKVRSREARAGQNLVEFAVALPVLLALILGLLEAARWLQSYLAVQYAAREAARYAVTGSPPLLAPAGEDSCQTLGHPITGDPYNLPSEYDNCRVDWIKHVARELAKEGLLISDTMTDITKPYYLGVLVRGSPSMGGAPVYDHPGIARTKIEVTVVYNHPVNNPFLSGMLPTIRITGRAQMVNEPWEGGGPVAPPVIPPAPPLPPLDTDGDGWSDIDERDIHGTLPSNPDTDGDGYFEGDGTLAPSEPADPDAPLDPCIPDDTVPACET